MKTKQTKVIFQIGLLAVLVNVVSSELLYTAEILQHIPDYDGMKGKNGQGELLKYKLINPSATVRLSYDTDSHAHTKGDKLTTIRFEVTNDASGTSANTIASECGGLPGITVPLQKVKKPCSSSYNCLLQWPDSSTKWDSDEELNSLVSASQDFCYKGMFIDFANKSKSGPRFLRLMLMFHDSEKRTSIGIQMLMFQAPTAQVSELKAKHNVLVTDDDLIPIREISKHPADLREKSKGNLRIKRSIPWMKDVLNRAKYIASVKMLKPSKTRTDWYYAGALMVKPEIITNILKLDSRWKKYIRH